MPLPRNRPFDLVSVGVAAVAGDALRLVVGPEGITLSLAAIAAIIEDRNPHALAYNIAARLALDNVDLTDAAAVKRSIELQPFRF